MLSVCPFRPGCGWSGNGLGRTGHSPASTLTHTPGGISPPPTCSSRLPSDNTILGTLEDTSYWMCAQSSLLGSLIWGEVIEEGSAGPRGWDERPKGVAPSMALEVWFSLPKSPCPQVSPWSPLPVVILISAPVSLLEGVPWPATALDPLHPSRPPGTWL